MGSDPQAVGLAGICVQLIVSSRSLAAKARDPGKDVGQDVGLGGERFEG